MSILENISQVIATIASLSAVIVALLAFWTYRDLRPSAQFSRRQDEHMNNLAAHLIPMLDRQRTFATVQQSRMEPDPFLFTAAIGEAKQLDRLLDESNRLHLSKYVVGQDHEHRWQMYGAFRAAVVEQANLNPLDVTAAGFTKQHFLMGMIRLANLCIEYGDLDLEKDLLDWHQSLPSELHEMAWTYLQHT